MSWKAEQGEGRRPAPARWVVFALASALFVFSQFYRVANAVIAPQLQRDLAVSAEALGGLSAAFFYAFAAAQVPLALLLDRVGARWTMTALTLVGSTGAVVFGLAGGLAGATLGRALLGIGMAGNLMGSMKLVAQWFSPREFATLSGFLVALGTLGNILATSPLALLASAVGWRWSFLAAGATSAATALLFWALVRDRRDEAPGSSEPGREAAHPASTLAMARRLLASRDYWLISVGAFFRYGTFLAIQGLWAGPYLMQVAGLSAVEAGNLILLLNVAAVLGSPLGGWLSDRALSSRKLVVILGLGGMAAAELALSTRWAGEHVPALAAILVLLGIAAAMGQVMYVHVKELMPARMAGMAMTGVNFFTMLGAAALLHAMGWVLDHVGASAEGPGPEGYRAAFLMSFGGVALALALYALTRDPPAGEGEAGRRA